MPTVAVLTDCVYGLVDRLHGSRSDHGNRKSRQRFYYTEHRLFEQSLDVYHPAGGEIGTAPAAAAVVCLVVGSAWLGHSRLIYGPTSWWNSSGPRSVAHVNVGGGGGVVCVCIRHRGSFPKVGEYFLKWKWIWMVLAAIIFEAFLRRDDYEPEHENENENENQCRHYYWDPHSCHSRFPHLQRIVAISVSIVSIVAAFIFSLLLLEKIVTRGGNNQPATFEEMQHDVMTALAWCHRHRDQILDNANDNNSSSSTRTRSPPFLFGGYSSGGHVAATLLQRPASFWTETHRLPPPEQFFAAALYISPVLATRSIDAFCRDEGVWDLLWKEEKKGENQYENGYGRGELPRENMKWRRKQSSSSTTESSASDSADSVASSSSSLALSSKSAIPLSTETSHSTATTNSTTSSSTTSSSSPLSSSSLEEQQQRCIDEQSSHNIRMESSKYKQCKQQQSILQKQLQKQLSPPTWLTDQILQLVFGTTQSEGNHINNHTHNLHHNHRNDNHHRPCHHLPPSPLHDYRKTPFLPHIFIGCQREVPFGLPWLDSFFVSRIYSILLREKLFPEWDTATKMVVVQEKERDGGPATGRDEHRFVVNSRYCEIPSTDHWNILNSRELFRVLEREIGRVVREFARGDSGE